LIYFDTVKALFVLLSETLNEGIHLSLQEAPITKVEDKALADLIIDSIQDIKGKNIIKLDLRELDNAPTDYFIICEGESNTQVRAISQNISKRINEELGLKPNHSEGFGDCRWILVDYFDLIVHIFYPETREFYNLENLWSDAKIISYQDV